MPQLKERPEVALADEFRGDDTHLVRCIQALLSLDAHGALVPHGIAPTAASKGDRT